MTVDIERALASLSERNVALERENKILREELALLKQARFGRSTERLAAGQLDFFLDGASTAEGDAAPIAPVPIATEAASSTKAKTGHGRTPFAAHIPRQTIELDVPAADQGRPG